MSNNFSNMFGFRLDDLKLKDAKITKADIINSVIKQGGLKMDTDWEDVSDEEKQNLLNQINRVLRMLNTLCFFIDDVEEFTMDDLTLIVKCIATKEDKDVATEDAEQCVGGCGEETCQCHHKKETCDKNGNTLAQQLLTEIDEAVKEKDALNERCKANPIIAYVMDVLHKKNPSVKYVLHPKTSITPAHAEVPLLASLGVGAIINDGCTIGYMTDVLVSKIGCKSLYIEEKNTNTDYPYVMIIEL